MKKAIMVFEQTNQVSQLEDIMVSNNLFNKFGLSKIGVFGSTARGELSNDIDILIEDNVDYRLLSELRNELQLFTNKRIDIVIAKYANPIVLHRAKKEIIYVTMH
jgi:Predicted nucleotidyltransferases